MKLELDWSAYDAYGQGDAYAAIPATGEGFGKAAALCIGSRQCQKKAADKGVMCPSFRITGEDQHSTRGRAAVLREALDGKLGGTPFQQAQLADAMALCVACKGCKRECPNGVDMAALRAETLAQRWRRQPPPLRTWLFARLPRWLPHLQRLRPLLALRDKLPGAAWAGERLLGIAARRRLPRLAAQSFLSNPPARMEPAEPLREVVLLVDCFSNHLEPNIARAALDVLQAARYRVHLLQPTDSSAPLCCGRTAWSAGLVDEAREHARRLVAALAPHLAAGRPVIGLEPSCLSMLRDEVGMLGLDAEAVQALMKQSLMLEEFLARELDAKRLVLPVKPLAGAAPTRVHVHGHCHQKAHGTLKALRKLLGKMPGLQVEWIESSCCGMAGSFGYEAEHYGHSMAMAELSLLPAVRAAAPEDLILASGTSCRQQIRDGAGRESLHLAELLQAALTVLPTAVPPSRAPLPAAPRPPAPAAAPEPRSETVSQP
ncbi:(Fe-S)-binding protein [Azohydromonas australica]|uniref:(Fe-S)-binding protein n=1 Tax=Azohydromonas australica TaxID=364039 RepID=UPI00041E3293|nr:4Fe-4S dicluster domain-containing protein [Azohydromonas australica]